MRYLREKFYGISQHLHLRLELVAVNSICDLSLFALKVLLVNTYGILATNEMTDNLGYEE